MLNAFIFSDTIIIGTYALPMLLSHGEESVELGVYLIADLLQVGRVVAKLDIVSVDNDEVALVLCYPLLVALVQPFEVVEAYGLLVVAPALLYLRHEGGYGGTDVDHEVGELDERHHQVEEVGIVVEVSV